MFKRVVAPAVAAIFVAALQSPSTARADAAQLPNLVALPPFDVQIGEADRDSPSDVPGAAIRFATGAANRSDYALELSGTPSSTSEAVAQQCVAWTAPRVCSERKEVGTFAWHPEHGHYHFQDFALYQLRKLRRNGKPDMRKSGLVATSGKVSYCIIDVERDESRGLLYTAPYPLYYSCLAGIGMQGISPGWKDIYSPGTTGQQIPLDGITDGEYALVVYVDPLNRLAESNNADNRSLAQVRLSGNGTKVEVLCQQTAGEKECTPTESST